jgi:hypothetical protein
MVVDVSCIAGIYIVDHLHNRRLLNVEPQGTHQDLKSDVDEVTDVEIKEK